MPKGRPQNVDTYLRWLRKEHRIDLTAAGAPYYEAVSRKIREAFAGSPFWQGLAASLEKYEDEYRIKTGYQLFLSLRPPELFSKPHRSFLLKSLRRNVLDNAQWPAEPSGGWMLPENWLSRINDIVRTTVVVKYLDGVQFLADKIVGLAEGNGVKARIDLEAKEEGYYAAHVYVRSTFELPKVSWDTLKTDVDVEIQITTQLQEVIRRLTHKYYETRRETPRQEGPKWQWNYRSDEFAANYLGHILHYLEGMIMEIRERQRKERRP
jgi:ppGpp synthetase/RelA/SpoT-type nucleotidyltranferase